jgi:hypothetical protein
VRDENLVKFPVKALGATWKIHGKLADRHQQKAKCFVRHLLSRRLICVHRSSGSD